MAVVEDDPLLARLEVKLIRSLHLQAVAYPDCPTALAQIDPARHGLVLVDLRLPGGDGLSLVRELRARYADAMRIAVVASPLGCDDDRRALQAGADGFLAKPFTTGELRRLVSELAGEVDPE